MSVPNPAAGLTHHVVIKYSNDTKTIGLMLTEPHRYVRQTYTPFTPSSHEGEATQQDFNITAVWEIANSWHMGTGHIIEKDVEFGGYNFSQGLDLTGTTTIGPCLFTGKRGHLLPPPADTASVIVTTGVQITNFKQFIEFGGKLYGLTSDAAGKIYETSNGTTWTLRETLTAAGTQLFVDGTTLYACQGAANRVRTTTDGTTWADHASVNAHFLAMREEGNMAYITTATLTPAVSGGSGTGPSFRTAVIGLTGTTATSMVYFDGKLWIGKPEGLYTWEQGWIKRVVDTKDHQDTSNFKMLCVHHDVLFYNDLNHLWFTNGKSHTEVTPEDLNGFTNLDCLFPTAGPLLIGARMQSRSYLFMFPGVGDPGLHPLWSDADAARPIVATCATDFTGTTPLIFLCQTTTGTKHLNFNTDWTPLTYHTKGTTQSYIELVEFTAGFRSVKKWLYQVVLNVRDPVATTFAQVWYSIDDGAFTQTTDYAGTAETLTLSSYNKGTFLPVTAVGVKIKLRIYLWTTSSSAAAAISAVTVRGLTMPKKRYSFSFPVLATETVQGLADTIQDSGERIKAALREIGDQLYPFKFQDLEGNWHLVANQTPHPLEAIQEVHSPYGNAALQTRQIVQLNLMEIEELDASGDYEAWAVG
jgi:hypothetical protein